MLWWFPVIKVSILSKYKVYGAFDLGWHMRQRGGGARLGIRVHDIRTLVIPTCVWIKYIFWAKEKPKLWIKFYISAHRPDIKIVNIYVARELPKEVNGTHLFQIKKWGIKKIFSIYKFRIFFKYPKHFLKVCHSLPWEVI